MTRVLIVLAVAAAHIVWFGLAAQIKFYDSMLYEGDTCTLADGVTSGTCRLDTNCLYLKTIPQKDWRTCSFAGNSSVVCCLNKRPSALQAVRGRFNYKSDEKCASFPEMPVTGNHILNGTKADAEEFPYLGALALYDRHSNKSSAKYGCGANLISDRFMLTAAHCLTGKEVDHVRLGVASLLDDNSGDEPVIIGIENFTIHPDYKRRPIVTNDIALIKLDRTVDEDFLIPACLYTEPSDPLPSVPLTIAGWGTTDPDDGIMSADLLKAQVASQERDECNTTLVQLPSFKKIQLHNDQLCALGRDKDNDAITNDTCVGDSGGPLELSIGRRKYIVGLTSTGRYCGTASPGIYTRVSQFIDWIERIVWP